MTRLLPNVTVFSSIPELAESLLTSCGDISFNIVKDDALDVYGGTQFMPKNLTTNTYDALGKAEILISEPEIVASLLNHDADCLRSLKWCQSTYAGVDPLFARDIKAISKPWTLTRFAGTFGLPIAEWCIARIIEHERSFAVSATYQRKRDWTGSRDAVKQYRYLSSLTLTVLGCGEIGRCIARAAANFGMKTIGFGKSHRRAETIVGLDEYTQDLDTALRAGDYVISILPSTKETRGLLCGEALASAAKTSGGKSPVFLNVGRGDVIDESSIISSLRREYISAAILDVVDKEPLPSDSPLWTHPNVIISPHVSGLTTASDVPKVFLDNYIRYVEGKSLMYVVDWDKGY